MHTGDGLGEPISRGLLPDDQSREDTVDLMVRKYEEKAVDVTVAILKKMSYNLNANEFKKKADILKGGGSKPSEENPNMMDDCYKMTSLPRGLCLIMNNQEFQDEYQTNRAGSNTDAVELAKVFSWLGFKVLMSMNNTTKEMRDVLKFCSEVKKTELQQYSVMEWDAKHNEFPKLKELPQHGDALVCCVLSHGCETGVCGTDSQILSIDELLSSFNGWNCPSLNNKPKLFFIQACRGDSRLPGVFEQTDRPEGAEAVLETDTLVVRATVSKNFSDTKSQGPGSSSLCADS